MTIDQVKAIQREHNLGHVHVVEFREDGFTVAHTEDERAAKRDGFILTNCALHRWLVSLGGPPSECGVFIAYEHEPDAYSEPYGAAPWDMEPIVP